MGTQKALSSQFSEAKIPGLGPGSAFNSGRSWGAEVLGVPFQGLQKPWAAGPVGLRMNQWDQDGSFRGLITQEIEGIGSYTVYPWKPPPNIEPGACEAQA